MATAEQESGKAAARAWLRRESRQGSRTARPVVLFGLAGTALAIGQAYSAAFVLGAALDHGAANVAPALAAFAMLALLRAALAVAADRASFDAGAAARRRLRRGGVFRRPPRRAGAA